MPVNIQVAGVADAEAELRSLRGWLSVEEGLGDSRIDIARRPIAGNEMGAVVDVLFVTLGAGGAGAVLARSVSTWLQTRGTDIKIKIKTDKGAVEIDARRIRATPSVLRDIALLVERSDDSS